MNYFASPTNSDRARRFRLAFGNATPGQDFMFEGQPYAGPQPQPQPQVQPQVAPPPNANARTHFSNYPDPTSGTTPITPEGPANRYDINQASPEQMRAMQEQIGGPGFNSPPRFASVNNATARGMNLDPNFNAPMGFNGGQPPGLLTNNLPPKNQAEMTTKGIGLREDLEDTDEKSGWERSDEFNNEIAKMLLQFGMDNQKGEKWEDF